MSVRKYVILTPETKTLPELRFIVNPIEWNSLKDWHRRAVLDQYIDTQHIPSNAEWNSLDYNLKHSIAWAWEFNHNVLSTTIAK